MKYYSLNHNAPEVSFKEAVIRGLAPDKGLYFPERIDQLPTSFFADLPSLDDHEIAFRVIQPFVGDDIPEVVLRQIIAETLSFELPVKPIEDAISVLELYHGPTLAFKDVGARFMARCLAYFASVEDAPELVTVLVATSGDTGGAVANGFYEVEGVNVIILYPSGKVSDIQEKQLTTLGQNITALEVEGTFDDCQEMAKNAFLDPDFHGKRKFTSANSINVARWLPQMFYYFLAYKQRSDLSKKWVVSVPSGNYGNICAGMMAKALGLPIDHFVAGTNANDVVPQFLKSGEYNPQPSITTIANAMDVGDPSNFVRILELFKGDVVKLRQELSAFSYSDEETREAIRFLFQKRKYIADPHGAIGYLALKAFLKVNSDYNGIFLETAHPVKFLDVIPPEVASEIVWPLAISEIIKKEKKSIPISSYSELKSWLLLEP